MRRRPLTGAGSIVQSVRSAQGAEVVRRHTGSNARASAFAAK